MTKPDFVGQRLLEGADLLGFGCVEAKAEDGAGRSLTAKVGNKPDLLVSQSEPAMVQRSLTAKVGQKPVIHRILSAKVGTKPS